MKQNQTNYKEYILWGILLISLIGATRYVFFKLDPLGVTAKRTQKHESYIFIPNSNQYLGNYNSDKKRLLPDAEGELEKIIEKSEK